MTIRFAEIDFGAADASNEAADNKDLLLDGYFDLHNAKSRISEGPEFLVLGPKGSGKTALAEHLLLSAPLDSYRTDLVHLDELPFNHFARAANPEESWETALPSFWKYQLLLQLMSLIRKHEPDSIGDLAEIYRALETIGQLPALDLPLAIRRYSATEADGMIAPQRLYELVRELVTAIRNHRSSSKYVVMLDGLDEVHQLGETVVRVLSSLMFAIRDLNREFNVAQPWQYKFVVLCRSDLFDRILGANTEKLRQDRTVELAWYEGGYARKSQLAQLVNLKARVSDPSIKEVIDYFPGKLKSRAALKYLLDHTRHTPRDFLRILSSVQSFADQANLSNRLTLDQVNAGLRRYSEYFDREIFNQMSGFAPDEDIRQMFELLRLLTRSSFTLKRLEDLAENQGVSIDLRPLLTQLFNCSGIGMVRYSASSPNKVHYTFKYRNPSATLNLASDMRIHLGWRRALNIELRDREEREFLGTASQTRSSAPTNSRRTRQRGRAGDPQLPYPHEGTERLVGTALDTPSTAPPLNSAQMSERPSSVTPPAATSALPGETAPENTRSHRRAVRPQGPPAQSIDAEPSDDPRS